MAEPIREPGYRGQLISLGGVLGRENQGRQGVRHTVALSAGVGQILMPTNPRRISATVQIFNGTDDLQVFLGNDTSGPLFLLAPRDLFQIDRNLPWTGAVYIYSSGSMSVIGNEVTIQT